MFRIVRNFFTLNFKIGDVMQKKIIELLTKTDGYVSGSEISEQLGVSRQAVWKAINNLKEQGYKIDSVTNRGYRLVTYPHTSTSLQSKNT